METFMLLLTLWTADNPRPQVDVINTNMTGADCISAMMILEPAVWGNGYILSCEFDYGGYEE